MMRIWVACLLCGTLAACEAARRDGVAFDGQYFRSKAARVDSDDRRAFTVEVRPASASLAGALAAGRHEGLKYCVSTFGNSQLTWQIGGNPDPATYTLDRDTLVLQGTCEG